jgi:hypothetical protein
MLGAWKRAHAGEVKRRNGQERARGLMKLILRAWREEADGRKARSLRGAKDWRVEEHAPSRIPTDCLPTTSTLVSLRIPRTANATTEARLRKDSTQKELKCEGGGGRLPVARSALPAGSQARLLLMYIRLVEGGRLKARRAASEAGVYSRHKAKEWRCGQTAHELGAGWPGAALNSPVQDPRLVCAQVKPDSRKIRRLDRETRQTAQTAQRDQAGSSRSHGVEAGSSEVGRLHWGHARGQATPDRAHRKGKGKAVAKPQRVFKPGDQVMYGSTTMGWMSVTVVAVDLASLAAGGEIDCTILIGGTERSTIASKLCAMEDFETVADTELAIDTAEEMGPGRPDVSESEGEDMWEVPSGAEGTTTVEAGGCEGVRDGRGEHLTDELEPDLQRGDLIFQREDTATAAGCYLTGHHQAGRGIVPWSGQDVELGAGEDESSQELEAQSQGEEQADLPHIDGSVQFDRTRLVRSVPWRLTGALVRLDDCTDPRLRDREGVVEGWEPESGQVRVRVAGDTVRVWSSEVVRIKASAGEACAGRKRRTMSGPNTAGSTRAEGVKRIREHEDLVESQDVARVETPGRAPPPRPPININMTDAVTSSERQIKRGMRSAAVAGIKSDFKEAMRGIWKWNILRSKDGVPWGGKRGKDRCGEG